MQLKAETARVQYKNDKGKSNYWNIPYSKLSLENVWEKKQ